MNVDPQLIDIDLQPAGWIPSAGDRTFGTDFPDDLLVPRSEWRDRIAENEEGDPFSGPHPKGCITANYGTVVYNQAPESSCVYNATAGAMARKFAMQCGIANQIILSPMSGYCRVASHRHSGSTMWGALELTQKYGLLPSDKHGQAELSGISHVFHENTPFVRPSSLPDGWEEEARKWRVIEYLRISTREQFASSLLMDMPVVYGRSGHSIVGEDLVWANGQFLCRSCDSYGFEARDRTGRIYDSERNWATGGAWGCRSVTMPDDILALLER